MPLPRNSTQYLLSVDRLFSLSNRKTLVAFPANTATGRQTNRDSRNGKGHVSGDESVIGDDQIGQCPGSWAVYAFRTLFRLGIIHDPPSRYLELMGGQCFVYSLSRIAFEFKARADTDASRRSFSVETR